MGQRIAIAKILDTDSIDLYILYTTNMESERRYDVVLN